MVVIKIVIKIIITAFKLIFRGIRWLIRGIRAICHAIYERYDEQTMPAYRRGNKPVPRRFPYSD